MTLYTEDELKECAKQALPADDFSNANWDYLGGAIYYVSNIKDNMGKQRTLNVRNRDRSGDPPEIIDAITGERYWPGVKNKAAPISTLEGLNYNPYRDI